MFKTGGGGYKRKRLLSNQGGNSSPPRLGVWRERERGSEKSLSFTNKRGLGKAEGLQSILSEGKEVKVLLGCKGRRVPLFSL